MKGWYKEATNHDPPLAQITTKRITTDQFALYQHVPPLADNILVIVEPFLIDESIPDKEDIKWEFKWLCSNRYRGPSGMWADHLW